MQATALKTVSSFIAFERAATDFSEKRQVFAVTMAQAFVPSMTFDAYTAAARDWRADYQAQKSSTPEASQKAFERAISAMNQYLRDTDAETFTAPKAETKEAKAKAEARKAEAEKVENLIKTVKQADLEKKARGGDKIAAKAIDEIYAKARAQLKEKNAEMLKAIRAELAKADAVVLKQIAGLLGIK